MELPDSINLEYPEKYRLSVRITPEVFAFCVYETQMKANYYYQEMMFSSETGELNDIQQIIFDSDFLTLPFERSSVVFVSKDYDLIPHYIVQKDKKEALYNFTHYLPAKQILYSPDVIQQIVTVFNADEEVYKFLSRNLSSPEFYHHSNLLMQYLEERNKDYKGISKMYLNFHDTFVDVFCYNDSSQILHAITLQNETERNLVYHILNVWEKCGFDQNVDFLFILGGGKNDGLYLLSILREYLKNIERVNVLNTIETMQPTEKQESLALDLLILSAK